MRFLVSRELGRLAKWLRLLGYDTVYAERETPLASLLIHALREERIVLTRNVRLTGHRGVRTLWIQSDQVREQLTQVLKESGSVPDEETLFSRCLKCNTRLEKVEKPSVAARVPPYVYQTVEEFVRCSSCAQIFWLGTHCGLAEKFLKLNG